ncbi:MAG: outer membrane protein assembly factor BamD [Chlamydiia bacterium]|nr:outer membrane protein assembly factor BamD [Chlamydiia bacterium]
MTVRYTLRAGLVAFLTLVWTTFPLYAIEYLDLSEPTLVENSQEREKIQTPENPPQQKKRQTHSKVSADARNLLSWAEYKYAKRRWKEAANLYRGLLYCDLDFAIENDAHFFLAQSFLQLNEEEFARQSLLLYLEMTDEPTYLHETYETLYCIANRYRKGARRRLLGSKGLPKCVSTYQEAIETYDLITHALPYDPLTAQALYAKGHLLGCNWDYDCSIEAFESLIQRFPDHELAPMAYHAIIVVYGQRAFVEFQNPDYLSLAQIQLEQFREAYPEHPLISEAEADLNHIREIYAYGLYRTARLYERADKPCAAAIYHYQLLETFPNTDIARYSRWRLDRLERCHRVYLPRCNKSAAEGADRCEAEET